MDVIGPLIAVALMFLPVIVYIIRRKDYDTATILAVGTGFLLGIIIIGTISWLLLGEDKEWIGGAAVWIYAMYVAMKKTH